MAQQPTAPPPAVQLAHFHHVHMNVTDPKAAIEFYAKHFESEPAQFGGTIDALWTQKSWILFNKVSQPPPYQIVSAIYHIGWGAEDMKAAYQHQIDLGARFQTPLTDIVDLFGTGTRGRASFLYVDGPDHAMIEINTMNHHMFGHVNLLSDDPVAAGEWYEKEFGMIRRAPPLREQRVHNGVHSGPSSSLMMDNISFVWFPTQMVKDLFPEDWKGRAKYASPRGRVIDHIAFSVDHLDQALTRLRADGVKVLQGPKKILDGKLRSAFIAGPDGVELEIVEGHAVKQ
jgi:catechol 2,3-dioxygenase-like lactoylglutathione lyase family enzyme